MVIIENLFAKEIEPYVPQTFVPRQNIYLYKLLQLQTLKV